MDLFPDLSEPGILDELFYFGSLVLQVILGAFFFLMTERWMKGAGLGMRIFSTVGMVLAADFLLFIAFGILFRLSNPSLI